MILADRQARRGLAALVALAAACAPAPAVVPAVPVDRPEAEQAIARALDDLHDAAGHGDEIRYFAHFADDAVFLGTDATERWDVAAFRAYAHPHFAAGKGWKFRAARRAITLSADGGLAWFDEDLVTEKLGPARGSGVLALRAGGWKIEQYNLATVVPNDRFAEVRALLDRPATKPPVPFDARLAEGRARALAAARRGDSGEAESELHELADEAMNGDGEAALEAWHLHDDLVWMRWAQGELARARDALDGMRAAARRAHVGGNFSVALYVHELWTLAFLRREEAQAAPPASRPDTLAMARAARREHDERAGASVGGEQSVAVLDAFFAVRARDARGALAAGKRAAGWNADATALEYVTALALDLGGDHAGAEALRREIRAWKDDLQALGIVRRMEADAARAR